jgi:hypothetical protein
VCDTVAEFEPRDGKGPRRLLDVESQAVPDPDLLERDGEYLYRLRREKRYGPGQTGKYLVAGMVLNLTGPAQVDTLDMRQPELDDAGALLQVVQVTMREEDATETLRRIAAKELGRPILPWVVLMRGANKRANMAEWKRLALEEPDERRRADYGGLALVFAELAGHWALWKKELEGWSMQQSQQVLEWQAEARKEGLREGQQIGAESNMRFVTLRLLQLRTGPIIPPDLQEAANQCNFDELGRWFDALMATKTLDEFRAAINRPAP